VLDLPEAPGAKTPQKCPWWGCFRAHQGQKYGKSARGGGVLGRTRGKNTAKVPVVGVQRWNLSAPNLLSKS